MTAFIEKVWAWIKANWKWLLGPLGVLIWLVARATTSKTAPTIADGEIVGHDEAMAEADHLASVQKAQADAASQAQHAQIDAGHAAAVGALDKSLIAEADAVRDDSDKVNSYLKDTGKELR